MSYDSEARSAAWRKRADFHGGRRTRLYTTWWNMKARCHYDSADVVSAYKARGISVCDEWRDDFAAFRDWALANGYDEHLTIERIDFDGDYEPTNCKWITRAEQALNKRNNVVITAWGETKVLAEWARDPRAMVSQINISRRIKEGAAPEQAISHPPVRGNVRSPWRQIAQLDR